MKKNPATGNSEVHPFSTKLVGSKRDYSDFEEEDESDLNENEEDRKLSQEINGGDDRASSFSNLQEFVTQQYMSKHKETI